MAPPGKPGKFLMRHGTGVTTSPSVTNIMIAFARFSLPCRQTTRTMDLLNSLLAYPQLSDTPTPTNRNPTTGEIRRAAYRLIYRRCSVIHHMSRMDPRGKLIAQSFLDALEKETLDGLLNQWVKVRIQYSPIRKVFGHLGMCLGAKVSEYFTNRRVEEGNVYTPEVLRTLTSLWERWSDEKEIEKEFAFLFVMAAGTLGRPPPTTYPAYRGGNGVLDEPEKRRGKTGGKVGRIATCSGARLFRNTVNS